MPLKPNSSINLLTEIAAACQQFQWNFQRLTATGKPGTLSGQQQGSSIEWRDFRDYQPGDDIRHIDWAAYGRHNRLTVRLYREEISPWLDIIVDQSRSMAIPDGRKAELTKALAGFMHQQRLTHSRLYAAGEQLQPVSTAATLSLDAAYSLLLTQPAACAATLRHHSIRCLISDFLSPHEPRQCILTLAAQASQLIVISLLGPWEAHPPLGEAITLVDAENHQTSPQVITTTVQRRYLQRLQQLQQNIRESCYQCGAIWIPIIADAELNLIQCLQRDFLPQQWIEPRP